MSRKFYKLLIIGNSWPTILHIPKVFSASQLLSFPLFAAGVYLPEGHQPIIPLFQYSIIPVNCERSELSSFT